MKPIIFRWTFCFLICFPNVGGAQEAKPEVFSIPLKFSNVHVIRQGSNVVLIDAGYKGDIFKLEQKLAEHGLNIKDIKSVIVTHGHSDHAALASEIRRRSGAKIVLGRGDEPLAGEGHNDDLKPTNLTAAILKSFALDPQYESFAADIYVDQEMDLSKLGLSGRIFQMPGHTPGSIVVELSDGRAFVGDMILGGYWGGALFPSKPGEHYFHADRKRNLANILTLLKRPIHTFYLGHGGPVTREAVEKAFGSN